MGNPSVSHKVTPRVYIDPVCGMNVQTEEREITFSYQGCSYHFCAEGCRRAFESDPLKYLSPKPSKRKGVWGRYLDRLNKATGGRQMKCH